ncbi:LacI family transcriptional regulator [Microbacterium sp. EYE_5]|uniref:LacI family DNA-binding transcriptional regulator n=1 Tax=unclassified Microbacterium TaxID=2609290 RepID=UPI002004CE49|nr:MULTISPECIES: LacI family DNA-binding transcriptional regulator [unclassified Microbacterium]MCK6080244.1 LacI family transcriptional regulator [Microbacterium sp. EYE_382]MCK6085515.1 LacI family transcriptional regulator [Microbacterium sp. EYE_384]MCK6122260.1 LacI family transcriptional regulator [Microbacterium sp. EYE_80]MCK6126278.1 LacI family transcriptional regulator [Microbacterium sp. EYE_79]MCK6141199.1 LacI family transcriptional regulator [Microbacterium sp. EYE_39]
MRGPRLQDVAERAGVSMKTVSNVVRDYPHVSAAMREKVQRAIDELGYRPNVSARRLATGRTGLIAVAFADVAIPYFAELAHVASRRAPDFDYRVLLEETDATIDGERALIASSEAGLVDGMLFQPSRMSAAEIARHRSEIPIVLLGETPAPLTMDHVMIDNVAAAREITEHLLALGRRRIGFVGHESTALSETSRLRLLGYQEALTGAGITADPRMLVATASIDATDTAAAVRTALAGGWDVDAIVCRDDLAALGTLRALQERGIRVPEDVAVTGWDDTRLSAVTFPSLTSVSPDVDALFVRAMALLLERIGGYDGVGRHEIAPHRIAVRESAPCAARS